MKKICKFCMHDDSELAYSLRGYYYKCKFCGYIGPLKSTEEEALEAWNIYNSIDKTPPPCVCCDSAQKISDFVFCPYCGRKL